MVKNIKPRLNNMMGIEEQKAYERERIEEAKRMKHSEPIDREVKPSYKKTFTPANRLKVALRMYEGDLKDVAVANGVWKDSYAKLNPGLLRMTIGNQLQMKLDACQPVRVGEVEL